jgi:hypothetical protein
MRLRRDLQPEELARLLHDAYEMRTRHQGFRVLSWEYCSRPDRELMISVAADVLDALEALEDE